MAVSATYDLRRRVLRAGRGEAAVAFVGDDDPEALHLAVVDEDARVLAVASVLPASTDHRLGRRAVRLRGMAVEPAHQGRGLGSVLLEAVVQRARALGAEVVWAAGRDGALGFYRRRGWTVEGEGYLAADDLPHHTVVYDVEPQADDQNSVGGDGPGGEAGAAPRGLDATGDEQP